MTHLLLLLPLLTGQIEAPPPPPASAKTEDASPPADAPTVAPATPAAASPGPRVFLTVKSNRSDLLLFRRDTDATVCTMPCDALVPAGPDDLYYLGGAGISPSSRFDLTEVTKAARIDIRAGSRPAKIVGIIFTSVAVPTLLSGGGSMLWYGIQQIPAVQNGIASAGLQTWFNPISTLVTAIVELAIGGSLLTTGIILWSRNSTRMTLEQIEPPIPVAEPAPKAP